MNRLDKFSDEEFKNIISTSYSQVEALARLGFASKRSWKRSKILDRCKTLKVKLAKRVRTNHTDEEVRNAANKSASIAGCMKVLGLTPHGNAHKLFGQRLKNLGIKFEKAKFIGWNKGLKTPRRSIEEYLMLNGPIINSSSLRKKLIKEGLKRMQCEMCTITSWKGKKLNFELDHIDGNNRNNNILNLRILCPNCHSQTPTHSKTKSKV